MEDIGEEPEILVTLTIRLIRSFEHKNWKPLVVHNVSLSLTPERLLALVKEKIPTSNLPIPFKTTSNYDTFKIESQAFGAKTNDPLINLEDDQSLILKKGIPLVDQGVKEETEISLFKIIDYLEYKANCN